MANQEHLANLAKGVGAWNKWRQRHRYRYVDLRGADLCDADLRGVNLSRTYLNPSDLIRANLSGANLTGTNLNHARLYSADVSGADLLSADLSHALLREADLSRADLSRADLTLVDLRGADLQGTNLSGAMLGGADLSGAQLNDADLTGAIVGNTNFSDVNLSAVRGLDTLRHIGPSTIGLDSIYRSQGKIPESFLRGCGVPENFITYLKSLVGVAFDFYSCFMSYSTKDQTFADRLYADLRAGGVRCWFAPHDIQSGRKIHEQIDEAIRVYDKLLLILSNASMDSAWVKTEIAEARAREEQQKRQMLFPITLVPFDRINKWKLFDADCGIDSAREIREYFIPDFSNWKDHDSYQKAFDLLLRDLKAGAKDGEAA